MKKPIIEVRGVGKKYDIRHMRGGYIALRDVVMNVIKSPFSFLKSKAKQVVGLEKKEEFWALKDISFEVNKGEVVGIIGANGAGKSTLLKILSQITPPTEGEIILRGRVGSLLEVGTGFHPELSGRENIFLNGAILGMKRREIEEKFDQIVKFAGIEKFLDTPVKYYSSGMYVRLAFSVAAHMEPDILLVDEVLAVGDAEFQKKCLGKMNEITQTEGRTILFVSHNMAAIRSLCKKCILLNKGKIEIMGETEKVTAIYRTLSKVADLETTSLHDRLRRTSGDVQFQGVKALKDSEECWEFKQDEKLEFHFACKATKNVENLSFFMAFLEPETGKIIGNSWGDIKKENVHAGEQFSFSVNIPPKTFRPTQLLLYFALTNKERTKWYDVIDANVGLPILDIMPTNIEPNENEGLFVVPFTLESAKRNK